jgi:DNA-directed RNA polymerase sigma subunit (sigma70/sigma32)
MKTLSRIVAEALVEIQDNTLNYISAEDLKKYKDKVSKFISKETKDIIDWMIVNNEDYVSMLSKTGTDNAMAAFINRGEPSDTKMKELYNKIVAVVNRGRMLEIPVFQTKEQFNAIVDGKVALDEIVIDLTTEKGRNEVAKKYDELVWKIARQYIGKSSLDLDDLHSAGYEGLTNAMNNYGKKDDENDEIEINKKTNYTFLSYASFMIKWTILGYIRNNSHMVRIPISVQSKERKDTGANTKYNSISLDKPISVNKDGNNKTLADKIGDYERGGKNLDMEDVDNMWKDIKKALDSKFDKSILDIFYSHYGIFGYKKLNGKELMKKYGLKNQSNINAKCTKVFNYIKNTDKLWNKFVDIRSLIAECQHDDDIEDRDFMPVSISEINRNDEPSDYFDDSDY